MEKESKIILLADDDQDDQELLREAFLITAPGAILNTVSFGKEVLDYLRNAGDENLPALIILDYNMPDLNGAEVLQKLYADARYQHIPTVIWSTSDATLYKELCEQHGAREYFHKPHKFEDILELTRQMMRYC
ncbi:MAG TPA: response regulator [Chitinophagaceae bacterium]|nr:response regulator [Chitinophagaceae bacterium]